MASRWRGVAGLAAATGIVLFVGFMAGTLTAPRELDASLAPPDPTPVTVEVAHQVVQATLVTRGVVKYDDEADISLAALPGLPGAAPRATWLPEEGALIAAGDRIAEIAFRPILALPGEVPLVRDLTSGTRGPDVVQLQQVLASLNLLDPSGIDGRFGTSTARALTALYEAAGYDPPRAGGAVFAAYAELAMLPKLPREVRSVALATGDTAVAGEPLLHISAQTAQLVAALPSFEAAELVGGEPVTIVDDGTGATVTGRVVSAGTVVDAEVGGVPVLVAFDGRLDTGRDYRVVIELRSTGDAVLAVPETALYLGADGGSYVIRLDGTAQERVPVSVGITGIDGMVEVTPGPGADLQPGQRVVVGDAG